MWAAKATTPTGMNFVSGIPIDWSAAMDCAEPENGLTFVSKGFYGIWSLQSFLNLAHMAPPVELFWMGLSVHGSSKVLRGQQQGKGLRPSIYRSSFPFCQCLPQIQQ